MRLSHFIHKFHLFLTINSGSALTNGRSDRSPKARERHNCSAVTNVGHNQALFNNAAAAGATAAHRPPRDDSSFVVAISSSFVMVVDLVITSTPCVTMMVNYDKRATTSKA